MSNLSNPVTNPLRQMKNQDRLRRLEARVENLERVLDNLMAALMSKEKTDE